MYCVIMAGGKGTRFWPRSRAAAPKQLLDIIDEKTMIQETVSRVAGLVPKERIIIVTAKDHAADLHAQVPDIPERNILVEPFGRNTAPCICLAALKIKAASPDETMIVLPADHYIGNPPAFLRLLEAACAAAQQTGCLVTLGVTPDKPETGYGYIQCGAPAGSYGEKDFFRVTGFHEKPTLETARKFVAEGIYLWNSGMFVWKVSAVLAAIERYLPGIYEELAGAVPFLGKPEAGQALAAAYTAIESISIDYGVMEKADNVITVKGDFGWNDIGSWSAIYEIARKDAQGNAVRGKVIAVDSENILAYSPRKLTAVVGLKDVCIIETDDALLVCAMDRAQDVKRVVAELEKRGEKKYL
ncbi:MAG: mannose-1-phosphate guanylyltransferase [Pseudomonadota bacterium]